MIEVVALSKLHRADSKDQSQSQAPGTRMVVRCKTRCGEQLLRELVGVRSVLIISQSSWG